MRGKFNLKDLLNETAHSSRESKRLGRNDDHINRRNECLIDRYYYYHQFGHHTYEANIEQLSKEFFLSQITITRIIQSNVTALQKLKDKRPPEGYFTKKWEWMKW